MVIGKPRYLFIGLVLLFNCNLLGKELVIGENNFGEVDVTGCITRLIDIHAVWNWDQLPKEGELWDTIRTDILSGGNTGYSYWFKIEIENHAANQYLILRNQFLDELDLYFVKDSVIRFIKSGDALSPEKSKVQIPDYLFNLPQGFFTCYVRIENTTDFQCPLSVASLKYFMEQQRKENLILRLYLIVLKFAKYFLLSWTLFLFFIFGFIFDLKDIIPYGTFMSNVIFYGFFLEVILIIAYRIKILGFEKQEAERREIQEREDKRLYLREQAHEIKNPVHFASNYVDVLDRNLGYFNDLLAHYKELGQEGVDLEKKQKEIKEFEDAIEIELVKQELTEGVNSVELAFSRIKDIANNFDLGADLYCSIDVNKCITDTLLMIRKDLGEHIDIREELGEIPEIRSFTGKLGQVFTNIIKNAIEAIKEKKLLKNEFLFVKTSLQSEKLIIKIKDTGVGMTEQTKEKAFNKFYTTKAEGNGTGIGLSVCKKIIENHKGRIHIESERGRGTEFIIELPLN